MFSVMKKHLLLLLMLCLTGVGSVRGADVEVTVSNLSDFTSSIATANLNTYNHYILRVTNNISVAQAQTINSDASVTINIAAGKAITFTPTSDNFLKNYGNLTLTGDGTIASNSTGILLWNTNTGSLHVKSGNYQSKKVVIINQGQLRIDGGSFRSTQKVTNYSVYGTITSNVADAVANIYGGTFINNVSYNSTSYYFGAIVVGNGTVNVYGGIFDNIGGTYARSVSVQQAATAHLNIYGGYFKKEIYGDTPYLSYGDYTRYDFNGNTSGFTMSTPTVVGKDVEFANNLITDGIFTFNPQDYNIVDGNSDVTENAGDPKTWTISSGTQQTYTIHFVNNTGHGNTPSDMSEQVSIPANLPDYAEGSNLIKWYLDDTHTTPAVAGTKIKDLVSESATEITLYANWEEYCINNAEDFRKALEGETPANMSFKLTGNISNLTACTIPVGKTVHIDFNGHTISTSVANAITVNGSLYMTDTSDNANGGINASYNYPLTTNPGSYLEVNAGVYTTINYLAGIGGRATINGGTFQVTSASTNGSYCIRANDANSDVTINGGSFTATYRALSTTIAGAKVNIYGGFFNGAINATNNAPVNMYGGMKKIASDGSSFTTVLKKENNKNYYLVLNGMSVYAWNKDLAVDDSNNLTDSETFVTTDGFTQLKAGTFSFDPSLPIYNINGKSIVADGYRAVALSTTPATWTIKKAFILGDVNEDGDVNVGDITALTIIIQNPGTTGFNMDAADVNQDGYINVGDIIAVANIIQAN